MSEAAALPVEIQYRVEYDGGQIVSGTLMIAPDLYDHYKRGGEYLDNMVKLRVEADLHKHSRITWREAI